MRVGACDGRRVGLFVCPGLVGRDVVGSFVGTPVGALEGRLVVGRTVGWPDGTVDGCRDG